MLRLSFSFALLVILIVIISQSLKIGNLGEILLNFPKKTLTILFFISILMSLLKAWRFLILLKNSDIHLSFWDNFKGFVASQAITPLPGGETARGVLVKHQTGSSLVETAGPVLAQAYLEVTSAAIWALVGSLYFKILRIPALLISGAMVLIFIFFQSQKVFNFITNLATNTLKKLPKTNQIRQKLSHLPILQKGFKKQFFESSYGWEINNIILPILGLSLINGILGGLIILIISSAYHIHLNLLQSIFVFSAGMLIQSVGSISPGGIGFTEGGMVGVLLLLSINLSKALAIVIIFRLATLVFTIILGLIFLATFFPKIILPKKEINKII